MVTMEIGALARRELKVIKAGLGIARKEELPIHANQEW